MGLNIKRKQKKKKNKQYGYERLDLNILRRIYHSKESVYPDQ